MAKVTSKLQVTIPKALADKYGIKPGDDIDWQAGGDAIRVVPSPSTAVQANHDLERVIAARLARFDAETALIQERQAGQPKRTPPVSRGWTRDELYDRAGPR